VATIVVLVEHESAEVSFDSRTISALARLGVTNLALVQDERTFGYVLEGWAFEPAVSTAAAVAALSPNGGDARVLDPVRELAVSTAQKGALRQ
jgi:hypothetical protein